MVGSSRIRLIVISAVVLIAALTATVVLGRANGQDSGTGAGKSGSKRAAPAPAANGIWAQGTKWEVRVPKDNSIVAPDKDHAEQYMAVYRFTVEDKTKDGWLVRSRLEGGEGPFADGYRLVYAERGDTMVLTQVGLGKGPMSGAEHAPIALGQDFPLTATYTATPSDQVLKATPTGSGGLPPSLPKGAGPPTGAPPAIDAPPSGTDPSRPA